MIPGRLRISLLVAVAVFLIIVLSLLKCKRLSLKYTLLWLFSAVGLFVLVVWPEILLWPAGLMGIQSTMNALYTLIIAFIIMILMSITAIVSAQTKRIRALAEANALLEKRVRDLEMDRDSETSKKK